MKHDEGPAPHGTVEAARQFLAEQAAAARVHADLVVTYAQIGNDVGLGYAGRRLAAYLRAFDGGMAEFQRIREVERERRQRGPGASA